MPPPKKIDDCDFKDFKISSNEKEYEDCLQPGSNSFSSPEKFDFLHACYALTFDVNICNSSSYMLGLIIQ